VLREDDDADVGMPPADLAGGLDSLGPMRRRHPHVGEHRVGSVCLDRLEERLAVGDRRNHLDPGRLEQTPSPLANKVVILGHGEPQRLRRHRRDLRRGRLRAAWCRHRDGS